MEMVVEGEMGVGGHKGGRGGHEDGCGGRLVWGEMARGNHRRRNVHTSRIFKGAWKIQFLRK